MRKGYCDVCEEYRILPNDFDCEECLRIIKERTKRNKDSI